MRSLSMRHVPSSFFQIGEDVEENTCGDVNIADVRCFARRVTDAAIAATDKQQANVGDAGKHDGVVPGAAGQAAYRKTCTLDRQRKGVLQSGRAGHGGFAKNLNAGRLDATTVGDLRDI